MTLTKNNNLYDYLVLLLASLNKRQLMEAHFGENLLEVFLRCW